MRAHSVRMAPCPEYHECARIRDIREARAASWFCHECACVQEVQGAFRMSWISRMRDRSWGVLNNLNERAFVIFRTPGSVVLNIPNARSFRTPPIRPERTCIQDTQSGIRARIQDIQDGPGPERVQTGYPESAILNGPWKTRNPRIRQPCARVLYACISLIIDFALLVSFTFTRCRTSSIHSTHLHHLQLFSLTWTPLYRAI